MKTRKLLTKIKRYFDENSKNQRIQKKHLRKVLTELKRKGKELDRKLVAEKNAKTRKSIRRELNIVCAQRKKGLKLLKSLDRQSPS